MNKHLKTLLITTILTISTSVFSQYLPTDDFDGDGIINSIDLDDDNDGLTDIIESSLPINKIGLNYTPIGINEASQFTKSTDVLAGLDNKSTIDSRPRIDTRYWSSNNIKLSNNGYFRMVMNTNEDIRAVVLWNQFPFYNMLGRFNGGINPPCGAYETQAQYNKMGKYMTAKDMDIVVFYNNGTIDTLKNVKTVKPTGQDNVSHSQVIDLGKTFNDVSEIKLLFKDYWVRTGFTTYVPLSSLAPTYSAQAIIFKLAYIAGEANDLDVDGDNIYNRFDYDSDGDSISDAKESGLTSDTTLNYKFPITQAGTNGLFDSLEFWDNQYEFLGRIGIAKNYKEIATIKNNPNPDLDNDGILGDDIDFDNDGVLNVDEGCTKGGRGLTQSYISHMSPEFWCETSCGYPTIYGIMVTQDGRKIDYRYTAARTSSIFIEGFTDQNVDVMGGKTEYFEGVYPKNGQQNMGFIYMNTLNCNPNSKIIFSEPIANLRMYVNDIGADPTNYNTGAHYYEDWAFNQNINIYKPNYVPGYSFTVLNSTTLRSPRYGAGTVNLYNATDSISWVASKTCYGGSCSGLLSVATGTSNGSYTIDWGQPLPSGGGNYGDYNCTLDTDGDGIPNALDLDSDNDGCSDAYEAGATKIKTANYQFDNNVGTNGLHNTLETNDTYTANYNYTSYYSILAMSKDRNACSDTDLDSVANIYDIDDDNDGVLDFDENTCLHNITNLGFNSPDNTYQYSTYSIDSNNIQINSKGFRGEAIYSSQSFMPPFELEYTVSVLNEFGFTVALNPVNGTKFGYINSAWDLIADKYKIYMLNNKTITYGDKAAIANGFALGNRFKIRASADIIDYYKSTDNGVTWNLMHTQTTDSITAYNIGVMDLSGAVTNIVLNKFNLTAFCNIDTDNDGVQNSLDLDSDGDGCSDALEAGSTNNSETNYMFPPTIHGENGLNDTLETSDLSNAYINYISTYKPNAIDNNISNCCQLTLDTNFVDILPYSPTTCVPANDGYITIKNPTFVVGSKYKLSYYKDGSGPVNHPSILTADSDKTITINNLSPGKYSKFVIYDTVNPTCIGKLDSTLEYIINTYVASSPLNVNLIKTDANNSQGCNNGQISANVTGGNPPYTYLWSNGVTTATNSNLTATSSGTTYTVTVTDNKGCTGNSPYNSVLSCNNTCDATISMNSQTNIKCYGDASGSSVATGNSVSNPSSTFSFEWSNGKKDSGVLSSTLINVLSGTYTVSVTINGTVCPAVSQSVVLSQPTSVLGATTSSKDETGPTTTDGEVSVSASGGTLPYSYKWDDASMSTSSSVTGLDAGSYNVTVTDANGCSIVKSAVVNPGTCNNLSVIPSSKDITCYGLTNGELSSSVSGGSGNFTYTWMPGSLNGPTQTNVSKGTYTLTVLDNTTLCSSVNSISVAEPTQLSGGMAPSHVKCNGDSSGSIDLTVSGGISPYTYLWSTGSTTEDVIGLNSNTYLVIVTDKNGCTMTKSTTITEPSSSLSGTISPKASKISSSCNNGEATITVSGGIPPYTYNWSSGTVTSTATTSTSTGLLGSVSGITYTVSVTDANGCMLNGAPQSFVIGCTNNCDATISMNSQTNIKCYGDASGSSVATGNSVSNPSSTFSFEWSNGKKDSGVLSSTLINVLSGTYTVSVTINGTVCPAVSQSVVLSQPTSVLGATTSSKDETGPTTTDGEVSVSASGGTLPYSYIWDDASMSTSSSVTGLDAGSYNVTVTDANGCSIVKSAVVNPGTCNNLSVIPSSKDITCYGLTNGELSSSVSGGSGNFTYTWMPGSLNGPTQTNVSKGTYTLTVLDNTTLCSSVNSISVAEPTQLSGGMAPSHVKCNGDSSGSIDLTVSGGISPYTYLWSTGATTEDVIGLSSNTYLVIVTDKNGCTMTKSTTITEPSSSLSGTISPKASKISSSCNNGEATITVSGGIPPYTYNWSSGTVTSTATTSTSTGLLGSVSGITYTVSVTDANGCMLNGAPQSFVIGCTNNCDATISMNSQTNIKCYGDASGSSVATGNSVSNPSSTFSFEWSNGKKDSGVLSSTLINVLSGTYTVSVTINGTVCPAVSQSVVLSQPTSVLGATTSSKDETGPTTTDGEVSVSASGGTLPYSYKWDDASMSTSSSVTGLDAGSYNVTVTDANGCSIVKSAVVNPGTCNNLSVIPSSKDITCYGLTNGELSSSVSGGSGNFTYTWMPGSLNGPTQTNVSKGTYTLTVLDNTTLCSSVNSISVAEPTQLSGGMAPSHVKCNGDSSGSIDLTVSGGISPYTYLWSTGATTEDVIGLSSNTYLVIVTDKNGCTMTKSTTITEPSSSLSGTISPKASKISSSCNNGEATITVSGGIPPYTYNWSSGTVTSTATTSTSTGLLGSVSGITYTVSVTDANGCMLNGAPQSFVIGCTNNCDATISMNSQTNIKCYGDASGSSVATGNSVSNPSSTFSFEWSNGKKDSGVLSSTLLNVLSGTYTVSVTINGTVCPAVSQSVVLSQPTSVLGATTSSKDETGPTTTDGEVSVSASGGTLPYSYKWDDASMSTSSSVTGLDAGSYNVTVTDANGCSIVKSAVVNPGTCNNLSVIPSSKDITCYGLTNGELSSSVSGGSGNFTYTWMPGSLNGPTQTNVSKGTYTLTVLDNTTLCSSVNSISVIEPTQLSGGMAPSHVKCNGDSSGSIDLTVSGGISPYTYLWSTGATTEDVIGLNSNTYLVIVTDKNGCTMTKSTTITEPSSSLSGTISPKASKISSSCNNGEATITVSGGIPPYTYNWSSGTVTSTATTSTSTGLLGSVSGITYTVSVTDANGCMLNGAPQSFVIGCTNNCDATISMNSQTNIKCYGDASGSSVATGNSVSNPSSTFSFEWSNGKKDSGVLSSTLINVLSGTYTVSVTINGTVCPAVSQSVVLSQPTSVLGATTSSKDETGPTTTDGEVSVSASGGTLPYSYKWDDASMSTSSSVTGLDAGSYNVTVTDANGCSIVKSAVVNPGTCNNLSVIPSSKDITCYGLTNGELSSSVSGGSGNFTYTWMPGSLNGPTQTNVSKGTYTLTVLDNTTLCSSVNSISVAEPTQLSGGMAPSHVKCNGDSSGSIDLTVSGGISPYTYLWSTGATTEDVIGLNSNTYLVIVTDKNGCTMTKSTTITEPSSSLSGTISPKAAKISSSCNNGEATITVSGGIPPYTYNWSSGTVTSTATTSTSTGLLGSVSGITYTVSVTDANGCMLNGAPQSFVIGCTNNCDATISMNSQTNIKCYGDASGSSVATGNSVSNPSSTFSFEWSNGKKDSGVLSSTLINVLSGTYTVSVTINGTVCPAVSQSVVLSQPTSVLGATTSSKDETGPTTTDGEVSVSASGGTLPYSYIWDDASMSTSSSVTGLDAGSYNVTVTDANGCSIVKSAVVNPGTCNNLSVIPSSKDITCYGLTNGELSSSVSGGSGNFTYTWMPGSLNGPTQTNVSKGTYTLTVLDNTTLCSSVNSISVAEPTQLSGGMAPSHVKCNGDSSGSIDLTVSGGISPYTYLWSTGATTEDVIGLSSNTYLVIVTDKNGCTMTKSTTITEPSSSLSGTISPKASKISSSCNNGEATITVSGGIPPYTYNWSSGTVTSTATTSTSTGLLGSVSGITYTVSVTDANGCMLNGAPQSFVIGCTNNCDATISMNSQTNIKCYGDASGSSVATGNSVSNPSSTFSFEWSNGKKDSGVLSSTLINVLSGTYTVSVTINGTVCPAVSQSVVLSQPTSVLGATTSSKDETGPTTTDGEVSVSSSGGTLPYSYKWDDASMSTSSSVTGLDAGSYNVTVTDANGCSIVKSAVVNPGTCNNLSVIPSSKDITCYGLTNGELSSSVSGGSGNFTYTWMPGSLNGPTQTNVSKGTYTLTVLDNTTLCSSVNSISVIEPTQLSGGMAPSHVKCNGDSSGSIDLTVSGGISPYTYLWSTGATTEDVIGLNSNTYLVIVTDKNGCTMTKSTTITEVSTKLTATTSVVNETTPTSNDGSASVIPVGGTPTYTYIWSNSQTSNTINNLDEGIYIVTVYDANGCSITKSVDLKLGKTNIDTITVTPICPTCSTKVCPPTNEVISTGSATSIINPPSGYTVVGPDKDGCYSFVPNGKVTDTTTTKIVICDTTDRCDTSVLILYPPVPKKDTIVITTPCSDCPVLVCPIMNDVKKDGATYSLCDTTNSVYKVIGPDSNGCFTFTSTTSEVKDTFETCIIICNGNRCDTTVVFLKKGDEFKPNVDNSIVEYGKDNIIEVALNDSLLSGKNTFVSQNATRGDVIMDGNTGRTVYRPKDSLYIGIDSFVYTVKNENGQEKSTIVYVYIDKKTVLTYTLTTDTSNKTYIDSNGYGKGSNIRYQVVSGPSNGQVTLFDSTTGQFMYVSEDGKCGMDSIRVMAIITYQMSGKTNDTLYYNVLINVICKNLVFPTYISPNGDGINDEFDIKTIMNTLYQGGKLIIYNRWGNIVWRSVGAYDGVSFKGQNYKGEDLMDGVYYYLLENEDDPNFENKTGFIEIMRN